MRRTALALGALFGFQAQAWADEADRAAVLDQLQAKFSACVAFYTFKQSCGGAGETGRRLVAVKRRAQALAEAVAMSEAEIALRLELGLTANASLTGGCGGLSILENRRALECEALSSAPD